jgi:hypothetical protein
MIFDTYQRRGDHVWCSVLRDLIIERWQTLLPIQAPYNTTIIFEHFVSRVQMKSWTGKALETVNCCAFLKRRLIGAC